MIRKVAKTRLITLAAIAFLMLLLPMFLRGGNKVLPAEQEMVTGLGDPQTLLVHYKEWEAAYEQSGGDRYLVIGLNSSKGLSDEHSTAYGYTKIDLETGTVSAEVSGLPQDKGWDVWLVQDNPGPGRTVLPEPGDSML